MGSASITLLALTYLAGIFWFGLAQWMAIELDGERRVRISMRLILALVWPLTILIAAAAVLARQASEHHEPAENLSAGVSPEAARAPAAPDALVRIFTPRDAAR
ncbi:hypothetical protein JL101_030790 (plasmid) [Skermanella rosea]|uniref:hypothetical protein n=1 Tax=Skermanella rosea TaxID=1817965 RepID=UPI001933BC39|nr:hypothetical protein [Skermanella rosea]UEM06875.1 hypothetical protein JL101_030790 [Skermanella rosea]